MEKKKKKKVRFASRIGTKISAYFSDFGLRQSTAIILIVASIIAIVGISVPEEVTLLVGLYLYLVGSVAGIVAAAMVMVVVKNRRAPQFKRSLIALIVLIIVFALALTGVLLTHIQGIYN